MEDEEFCRIIKMARGKGWMSSVWLWVAALRLSDPRFGQEKSAGSERTAVPACCRVPSAAVRVESQPWLGR